MLLPHLHPPQPSSTQSHHLLSFQLVKRSVWRGGQLLDQPHQLISSQDLILVTDFFGFPPHHHSLLILSSIEGFSGFYEFLTSFRNLILIQVMWPAQQMATPQPPTLPILRALPFLTTRSFFQFVYLLAPTPIPYHQVSLNLFTLANLISPFQVSPAHAPQPLPAFPSKVYV